MSPYVIIDLLVVRPLTAIYEQIFQTIVSVLEAVFFEANLGWALVIFSLVVNFMLLPLYYQMESVARTSRAKRVAMDGEIARIKANFSGRERFFYLRTIYRHYGSSPLSILAGSADLYLQILVFATVYRFVVTMPGLSEASFYAVTDLADQDRLLFGINLLPLVMTFVNIGASLVYRNDRTRTLQATILAVSFLLLLYNKPAGLVLYWTCNNVFSLVRNSSEKLLIPRIPLSWRKSAAAIARQH